MSLLLVGRNVGLQSILSLIFNTGAILIAIAIHDKHPSTNLFILMSVAIIFSTIVTLLLVTGWHMRTWITTVGTLLGTFYVLVSLKLLFSSPMVPVLNMKQ